MGPLVALFIIFGGALVDLALKAWARLALVPDAPPSMLLPFISLRLAYNDGISFSLLSFDDATAKAALLVTTGLVTVGIMIWAMRAQGWERLGLSLVAAGAVANFADRAAFGAVTDYLGLHLGSWHPFIFNIADVWITGGAGVLLGMALWVGTGPRGPSDGNAATPR